MCGYGPLVGPVLDRGKCLSLDIRLSLNSEGDMNILDLIGLHYSIIRLGVQ